MGKGLRIDSGNIGDRKERGDILEYWKRGEGGGGLATSAADIRWELEKHWLWLDQGGNMEVLDSNGKQGEILENIREGSEDRNDDQIKFKLENIGKQATGAKVSEIRGQGHKKGREADERGDLLAKEITTEEIRRAVKQTKRGKAVG